MATFPGFDLCSEILEEDDVAGSGSRITDAVESPAEIIPPVQNSSQSKSSTPSRRKRQKTTKLDINGSAAIDSANLLDPGTALMTDFRVAVDTEILMASSNSDDRATADRSPSPSKLVVADEFSNAEDTNAGGGVESSSDVQLNTPPPSPDGITTEDRSEARCETCNISFSTKRQRSEHLRDVHGVEKPFKCEHCRARFPYSSSLYNHVRIHSESKPFKCNLCDAAFRWKNSLRHHRLHIHKEEPTTVQIAAKCVLEGKKPPPPPRPPDAPATRSKSKRANRGPSPSPFDIDVAKVLQEAESLFANAAPSDNGTADKSNGAASTPTPGTADGRKRQRKQTPKRNKADLKSTSASCSRIGHTCGHCEKEFVLWADLVSHIKECASKETAAFSDVTPGWSPADGNHVADETKKQEDSSLQQSDADSDAPSGLIIDQYGGVTRIDDQAMADQRSATQQFTSYSGSSKKKKRRLDVDGFIDGIPMMENGEDSTDDGDETMENEHLEQRVAELEKRVNELARTYDSRIGVLESTVSRLKSQLDQD